MNFLNKYKYLFALLTIPLTVFVLQQQQESRSRATASTTLLFSPSTPLSVTTGENIDLDVMIDPGNNFISTVRVDIDFDSTVLELSPTNPFTPNTAALPVSLESPLITAESFTQSLSIGNDPTKAINQRTKVGTLHFKAIGSTTSDSSKILFGSNSLALSLNASDSASENVISTTIPASVIVIDSPTTTPTVTPEPTLTTIPTILTPTPELTPTTAPTPTSVGQFSVTISALLHGIGAAGDNINPTANSLSNKNPAHPSRTASLSLYSETNQLITSVSGEIEYSSASGSFSGPINLASSVPSGNYIIKVKTSQHLARRLPGVISIINGQNKTLPEVSLVTGDTNNDNALSIMDYNLIIECYHDIDPTPVCNEAKQTAADLNDDSLVNSVDYNLFLREISYQSGD